MQASMVLSFLLLLVLSKANAQQRNFNLSRGSSLSPTGNSSLFSQSGTFAFGFFPFGGGFAVGIWLEGTPQKTVVWTANRNDPPVSRNATIGLTNDGIRLILQEVGGQEKTIANTTERALFVSMLDTGNLVLYNSNSTIIWQSFDYPTDTLLPGLLLRARDQLISSISETNHLMGSFRIKMQTDGNIVMYPVGSLDAPYYAYWAAATNFVGKNATLTLDGNGRLYMLNSSGAEVKNITNGAVPSDGKMYRATIDADGIFRVYSHNLIENGSQSTEWSVPDDRCSTLKGICGINAYCDLVSLQPVCACPPGFDFINQEQRNLGCNRNFIAESCAFKNDHMEYTIQELRNVVWMESTYAILSSVTREECNLACLEDCNCEAVQFQGQECKKQKLPLTFGRRTQQDQAGNPSPTTLVKVGMDSGRNGTMDPKEPRKVSRMDILVIGVACLSFALIVLAFSAVLIFRYRLWAYKRIPYKTNDQGLIEDVSLRAFTYNELEVATSGFSEQLGKGAFGTVFKGTLSGQRTIAVKRLHQEMVADGEVEFRNEMRSIGRTHHRNLVRLLGYCHDGSNRILVYEYMSNGTLSSYVLKSQLKPNWEERINIALDIASGILYLHEECEIRIIHCDLNPNNILMDEYGRVKIADFGLAKLLIPDHSRTLTGVRGTRGYVAPEWHKGMPISVKADIFSFGIMFFVIICCRKSVDNDAPEGEAILAKWVNYCFEANELSKLVPEEVDQQSLKRMIKIGLWCIEEDPEVRPLIKKVIQMLEGTVEIAEPPSAHSSFQH